MKPEQIIIDVTVVKNWNWMKCGVKDGYYRVRNWWWGVSWRALIGDLFVAAAAVSLFRDREYFLLGVLLATYFVLVVAKNVWNAICIRQQYENRKFAKENQNMSFEEIIEEMLKNRF